MDPIVVAYFEVLQAHMDISLKIENHQLIGLGIKGEKVGGDMSSSVSEVNMGATTSSLH